MISPRRKGRDEEDIQCVEVGQGLALKYVGLMARGWRGST